MPEPRRFDLVVVGGGSGGYAAAKAARHLGAEVAIVAGEEPLGGLCILRGCMPSKALLASADAAQRVREADRFGIEAAPPRPRPDRVIARKRRLIDDFAAYRAEGLEDFPLFRGAARFLEPRLLAVTAAGETDATATRLTAERFIVATGSVIARPPVSGLEALGYLTSDDLLDDADLPASMTVLGGGYVACELGQYLHRMGVRVRMLLRAPRLLSSEDPDVGDALTAALREEGIAIETGARLERAERAPDGRKRVVYRVDGGEEAFADADEIAMFLGRMPAIDGLNLEAVNVRAHAQTGIEVDATLRTSNPEIYAVGDVTGVYPLVHVAIAQGELAARNALRAEQEPIDYRLLKAHTVFTEPQVAIAGETERELRAAGVPHRAASYAFADHGKALTLERPAGFVKLVAAPDGRLLGAAAVGAEASELIHETLVALRFGATAKDLAGVPHLHPTLSEIWTYPAEELAGDDAAHA